jgi:TetR/AcrR family transcriptional regulator
MKVLVKPALRDAKVRSGSRHQPEQTRKTILDAAEREFADQGIDGARIDAIARRAGVNKALLYYYFQNKEGLYGAVLDRVFGGLKKAIDAALDARMRPGDKILAYAGAHFDFIAKSSHLAPRLIERELIRAGRHGSPMQHVCGTYFVPIFGHLAQVIAEGIHEGDFRPVDPIQFIPSMVSVIVFYFVTLPVLKQMRGGDPLSPESLAARRAAVLDFISAALFRPRASGAPGDSESKEVRS